ncbi:hypothetical protein CJO96_07950 [Ralstonia solanacearum]|uniref:hypothetical protein n=1 Tax=Ralstonia pseudosolanacearum TaxID=1310165 RepID=UPI000E59689D|nr:hypothetical protein CJO84_07870 [Ralstonia solanacearum]AXW38245.1 hypothetical protein CJO89_07960 [Ralstonia solanacearum]AXW71094.1 hypothetical protein CJO96_07950 [Ralstonia solanacearum]BEU67034.1 hypothetical protein MAFF301069_15890 [Ralstonia pseudosolanacearum]
MRHAVAHPEQVRHSQTARYSAYPKREVKAAYNLGKFAATYWPAARKAMPAGATIGDYRIKCEADLLVSFSPEGYGLLEPFLEGFNDEVAQLAMYRMPGFEDAREVLAAEARMYEQQAEEASLAHEAAWRAIEDTRRADEQAQQRARRATKAGLVASA